MVEVSPEFRARLNRVSSRMRLAAADAMEKGADELVEAMKRLAPVDSGALRDSIGWTWGDAPKGAMVIDSFDSGRETADMRITIYAGGKEAFYARFVEFGTRPHSLARNASVKRGLRQDQGARHPGTAAQPFFFPAYRAQRRRIRARITREIRKAIQQEG